MQPEPEQALEREVAALCAEIGPEGTEVPGPEEALSALGFDSLACADLASTVEERYDVRLSAGDVASLRTVSDVARMIERKVQAGEVVPKELARLQGVVRGLVYWPLRLYTRLRVSGREHIPSAGPGIVVANHRSMLDIPILVMASPRRITFMAKQQLFADPFRRRLWLELGGFPVRREIADIRSVNVAIGLLEQGELVGMYPEGKRSLEGGMLPFLRGPAWMALRTGVPVIPCGVIGTGIEPGWNGKSSPWIGKHVRVAFGPAIEVEKEGDPRKRKERANELTEQLLSAVTGLM